MRYTVAWLPSAQDELARIWMNARDRQAVGVMHPTALTGRCLVILKRKGVPFSVVTCSPTCL